ncbi:putative glutamic protease eqolisin [Phaeomoniella chlamydospora]|uniref:Putative glutamic protease eqolisin n=1 Tax=Phaeomoniella chlamydospora TaxID=158046 RepID=A0A0G2GUP9_PHACM|nr:putative glutamic protease eqolisin [Phaeomoniella chlamydospora]
MKFSSAILSAALLAGSAVAAPGTVRRRAQAEARRQKRALERHSNPRFAVNTTMPAVQVYGPELIKQVEYSTNWAGVVLIGSGYTAVTGEITVPTPTKPSGGSSSTEYCASAWVGIDGDTCDTAILQTGVDFCVQGSSVSYDGWYEWYPDYAYDFSGITFSAGDVVKMTVTATSKSAGSAVLENVTTGKTVTHTFSGESNTLCETNAEWIVEDFSENNSLVPFADFGTVTFTDAYATTSSGTVGVSGGSILDIKQNGQVLTSVSTSGSEEVIIEYV